MAPLLQCTGPVYAMSKGFQVLVFLKVTYIVHNCNQIVFIGCHPKLCNDVLVRSPIHDSGIRCLNVSATIILNVGYLSPSLTF